LKKSTEVERDKYEYLWARGRYGGGRGAENQVPKLLELFKEKDIIEFGCGPGRAGLMLKYEGKSVIMTDIAENSLDRFVEQELDYDLIFKQGAAHEINVPAANHTFSSDLLEHIPPDMIDVSLDNIFKHTMKSSYHCIALQPDTHGPTNNMGQLHLTLEKPSWWKEKLEKYGQLGYHHIQYVEDKDNPEMVMLASTCVFEIIV